MFLKIARPLWLSSMFWQTEMDFNCYFVLLIFWKYSTMKLSNKVLE